MNLIHAIKRLINQTTMYRVVIYVLVVYVVAAIGLSLAGYLFYTLPELSISLTVVLGVSTITHYVCKHIWSAPANYESTLISALIIFLIFDPTISSQGLLGLAVVSIIMVISKYIISYRNLHITNPVVIAAVLVALIGLTYATWWVGNYAMALLVLAGGVIITYKIRRFPMVISTIVIGFIVYSGFGLYRETLTFEYIQIFFLAWPILFLATVMVTEPLSTPAGTRNQVLYGALVGALSSTPFHFDQVYSSPEIALLLANIVFYPTTLMARMKLSVQSVKEIARETYEIVLSKPPGITFVAGQYLEWTLPHKSDKRGIRRYFTIASAPSEPVLRLGMRYDPNDSSSYKKKLIEGEFDYVYATSLQGDFLLPQSGTDKKIVMIAGGIGVTPFRSQVRELLNTKQSRDVTLLYCNETQEDIAYTDLWQEARESKTLDFQVVHVLAKPESDWPGYRGYITVDILQNESIELDKSLFYVSGSSNMVRAVKHMLQEAGVPDKHLVTDYFPGLA